MLGQRNAPVPRRLCATRCVRAAGTKASGPHPPSPPPHPLSQREKLEEDYRERKRRLEEWEQRSKRALEVRERELERELYQQRQGVLRELESVRTREKELKQGAALETKTLELERERMEEAQRQARARAQELETARVSGSLRTRVPAPSVRDTTPASGIASPVARTCSATWFSRQSATSHAGRRRC